MNSDMIWQILRYALLAGFGWLANKGYGDAATWNTVVGAIGAIFTAGWGIYVKMGTKAVPVAVANRPEIPTVSAATGSVNP